MNKSLNNFTDGALDSTKSLYWLSLAVMSNFVGESLGCKTQYALTTNMYLKNMLLIMIIFLGVDTTSDKKMHPANVFMKSFVIWLLFLGFNRMRPNSTAIVTVLVVLLFILMSYKDYLDQEEEDKPEKEEEINKTKKNVELGQRVAVWAIMVNIVIGVSLYWMDKKEEYGKDFDFMKFIMGVQKCKSLN